MTGLLYMTVAACGKDAAAGKGTTPEEARRREPTPLERRACSGGTTQTVDANNDGRPDITHHIEAGARICSEIDMNFDGKTDVIRFYAKDGKAIAFEQYDFDFDGRLDEQSTFVGGALKSKEMDTNFDGLIDTWLWCNGAFVERAERARRKAATVDTIEIYQLGLLSEIQYDEDSNGKPEKWEIYRSGELVEVKYDDTSDGQPDRAVPIVSTYDKDEPVSCDGSPVSPEPPPAPAAPAGLTESENQQLEDNGLDTPKESPTEGASQKPAEPAKAETKSEKPAATRKKDKPK
jgi:hypothetical protein